MTARTTDEWALDFGERIRALRMELNLSQAEVAALASIGRPALHSLESGRGSSLSTLIKVLRALDSVYWLTTVHATRSEPSPMELLRAEQARPKVRSRVRKIVGI
ncbi:MAG: helix-turn-helix transcriptional regulator [Microbacteriaceae bacterium]|nr:helix-turn-helix transcriptional regulator [Microbacteriaceae bacterium]